MRNGGNSMVRPSPDSWCMLAYYYGFPGGLIYVNLLGKDFIIIGTARVAHDLMDRRSTIYSERPFIKANEMYVIYVAR